MKQFNIGDQVIILKYSRTIKDIFIISNVSPPNEFISTVHYEIKEHPFDVFYPNELIKI